MKNPKEKVESLVICSNPEFKRLIDLLLIDSGYGAEKVAAADFAAAKSTFEAHHKMLNVVINGADFPGKQIFQMLTELAPVFACRDKTKALVFVDEVQQGQIADFKRKTDNIYFEAPPLTLKKVNNAFHPGGKHSVLPGPKVEARKGEAETASQKNLSFYEASNHLRDTIDHLKKLTQNRSDLGAVARIGQRFNGIFGAFSFMTGKAGYKEILELSHIIDDIARHYGQANAPKEILEPHYRMMLEAAKCTYKLLMSLRENKPLGTNDLLEQAALVAEMSTLTDIVRYEEISQSQDAIDALLDAGLKRTS